MLKFNDYLKEAALSAKQKKIAAVAGDKDKIDAADLAALRNGKKPVEEASCSDKDMKKEELVGNQHKLDKNKNGKLDAHDFKLLRKEEAELDESAGLPHALMQVGKDKWHIYDTKTQKVHSTYNNKNVAMKKYGELNDKHAGYDTPGGLVKSKFGVRKEEVELDEGRVKELAMDLKDMSHDEFHKQYGKPKSHFDPTNFKKPVEPGKGMDRAKALAQRGMQSLSKEEVERIEEKLTHLDELSKNTLGSYVKKASGDMTNREVRINNALKDSSVSDTAIHKATNKQLKRAVGFSKAVDKLTKEEVEQEMSPYLKGTLKVMDEGKIDNLRDAQKLRQDMQSAYDKDYKPDTSHPHIQVVKGSAYGGANQKDDEGDEKPDETKEKKGRGRPTGSKSGARQKGGGHEDGGIPVHNLNLPKSYK